MSDDWRNPDWPEKGEQLDLDALEKLCDAATPGPWFFSQDLTPWRELNGFWRVELGGESQSRSGRCIAIVESRDSIKMTAAFIAAARGAVPKLIAEVRRQRDAGRELLDSRAKAIYERDKLRAENEVLKAACKSAESNERVYGGELENYRAICALVGRDNLTDRALPADFDERIRWLIREWESEHMARVEAGEINASLRADLADHRVALKDARAQLAFTAAECRELARLMAGTVKL